MLGIVNNCFIEFLRERFGAATVEAALKRTGIGSNGFPSPQCPYADELLLSLVHLLADEHDADEETLHYDFGRYFVNWTDKNGYAQLMRCLGGDIIEFLRSLNNLHLHLSLGIPGFLAPEFRVQEVTSTSLVLHYHSQRQGLWPWVEGILDEVANLIFGIQIQMEMLQGRHDGTSDHEVYRILFPAITDKIADQRQASKALGAESLMGLDPETFYELFPFHFVLGMDMRVQQVGSALEHLVPELHPGVHVKEALQLHHPHMPWAAEHLLDIERETKVVLVSASGLELKGGLYRVRQMRSFKGQLRQGHETLLFMGSPRLCSLSQLQKHQFYLSNFPVHDMAADFVLLADQRQIEWDLNHATEINNIHLKVAANQLLEDNTNLKTALAYTLERDQSKDAQFLTPDSPADSAIKLFNSLLLGHQVRPEQVLHVRNLLLRAGTNLWQPLDFDANEVCGDDEVKAALEQMLGAGNKQEEDMSWLSGMPSERSPKGPLAAARADSDGPWQLDRGDSRKALSSMESSSSMASVGLGSASRQRSGLHDLGSARGLPMGSFDSATTTSIHSLVRKISNDVGVKAAPSTGGIALRPSYSLLFASSHASDSPPTSMRHHDSNISSTSMNEVGVGSLRPRATDLSLETSGPSTTALLADMLEGGSGHGGTLAAAPPHGIPGRAGTPLHQGVMSVMRAAAGVGSGRSRHSTVHSGPHAAAVPLVSDLQVFGSVVPISNSGQNSVEQFVSGSLGLLAPLGPPPTYAPASAAQQPPQHQPLSPTAVGGSADGNSPLGPGGAWVEGVWSGQGCAYLAASTQGPSPTSGAAAKLEDGGAAGQDGAYGHNGQQGSSKAASRVIVDKFKKMIHNIRQLSSRSLGKSLHGSAGHISAGSSRQSLLPESPHGPDQVGGEGVTSQASSGGGSAALLLVAGEAGGRPSRTSGGSGVAAATAAVQGADTAAADAGALRAGAEEVPGVGAEASGEREVPSDAELGLAMATACLAATTAWQGHGPMPTAQVLQGTAAALQAVAATGPREAPPSSNPSSTFIPGAGASLGHDRVSGPGPCVGVAGSSGPSGLRPSWPSALCLGAAAASHTAAHDGSGGGGGGGTGASQDGAARGGMWRCNSMPRIVQPALMRQAWQGDSGPLLVYHGSRISATHSASIAGSTDAHTSPPEGVSAASLALGQGEAVGQHTPCRKLSASAYVQSLEGLRSSPGPIGAGSYAAAAAGLDVRVQLCPHLSARISDTASGSGGGTASTSAAGGIGVGGVGNGVPLVLSTVPTSPAAGMVLGAPAPGSSSLIAAVHSAMLSLGSVSAGAPPNTGAMVVGGTMPVPADLPGSAAAQLGSSSGRQSSRRHASPLFTREPAVLSQGGGGGGGAMQASGSHTTNPQLLLKLLAQPPDLLASALAKVDEWQYDAFNLASVSFGKPLSCLAFFLMKRMELIKKFDLNEVKLARFLLRIEKGYPGNPYHCRTHAADVLRTLHVLLTRGGVLTALTAAASRHAHTLQADGAVGGEETDAQHAQGERVGLTKLLACYLAAIIHDFDHRGVNNVFLVRNSDPLALLYNDTSPMENHHLAAAFMLMHDDHYAFFSWKARRLKEVLRKDVIDMVLATDMKQHFSLTSLFNSKMVTTRQSTPPAEPQPPLRVAPMPQQPPQPPPPRPAPPPMTSGELEGGSGSHSGLSPDWDHDTQTLVLKLALKCADLGHLASSTEVHKEWVGRLEEEMFRQGDQERALGLTVSPLMDRTKGGVTKSQAGFFNVVALPMLRAFTQVFTEASEMLANVSANYHMWVELEAQASTSGGSAGAGCSSGGGDVGAGDAACGGRSSAGNRGSGGSRASGSGRVSGSGRSSGGSRASGVSRVSGSGRVSGGGSRVSGSGKVMGGSSGAAAVSGFGELPEAADAVQ